MFTGKFSIEILKLVAILFLKKPTGTELIFPICQYIKLQTFFSSECTGPSLRLLGTNGH